MPELSRDEILSKLASAGTPEEVDSVLSDAGYDVTPAEGGPPGGDMGAPGIEGIGIELEMEGPEGEDEDVEDEGEDSEPAKGSPFMDFARGAAKRALAKDKKKGPPMKGM